MIVASLVAFMLFGAEENVRVFKLDEAYAHLDEVNADLVAAREQVTTWKGNRWQMIGRLLPHVSAEADVNRNVYVDRTNATSVLNPYVQQYGHQQYLHVGVDQIILSLPTYFQLASYQHDVHVQRFTYAQRRIDTQAELLRTYFNAKAARESLTASQEAQGLAEKNENVTKRQQQAGAGTAIDVLRAQAAKKRSDLAVKQADLKHELAERQLSELMATRDRVEIQFPDSWRTEQETCLSQVNAHANSLAIRAAMHTVQSWNASESGIWLRSFPELHATVSSDWNYGQNFVPVNEYWTAQLRLVWNIFDGGEHYGEAMQHTAEKRTGIARLNTLQFHRQAQLDETRLRLESADSLLQEALAQQSLAQALLDAATRGRAQGASGMTELLEAQTAWAQAKQQKADAEATQSIALVDAWLQCQSFTATEAE